MRRIDRLGWWAFGLLLAINALSATFRSANGQSPPEAGKSAGGAHGKCIDIVAVVARDGDALVFRGYEDGTVEERRAESIRDGKITYTWKSALRPAE